METEEAGYSKLVVKHRTKTYQQLQNEVEHLDVKEIEAEKRIETFSLMTRQKTHSIEMARRQGLMTAMQDDTRAVAVIVTASFYSNVFSAIGIEYYVVCRMREDHGERLNRKCFGRWIKLRIFQE